MANVIGLDIGGTKIEGIVFDGQKILKSLKIVTPKNLADLKHSLLELVKFLSADHKVEAIGIGAAGIVDPQKGTWLASPNIKFIKNFNLAGLFRLSGVKQVKIDNDASCFTRAEALLGQGKSYKNIIGVILGTGIGSGLFVAGQNFRGSHYSGGEIGQLIVDNDTLEHHYQRAKQKGDIKEIGRLLAVRFADLINILDPDCFILGGSFSQYEFKKISPQVLKIIEKNLINKKFRPKILISRLTSAGSLGSALLFR
jgi:predicted NBD/HSP70 family sugar kinase